jgi:hypothetical protein
LPEGCQEGGNASPATYAENSIAVGWLRRGSIIGNATKCLNDVQYSEKKDSEKKAECPAWKIRREYIERSDYVGHLVFERRYSTFQFCHLASSVSENSPVAAV